MKIVAVETLRIAERPNLVWVRLRTDEGITGLGESWFGSGPVEADVHERIAPLLLGADPGQIQALSRKLRPYVGFFGTGAEMRACANVVEQEITRAFYYGWYHELVDTPPPLENGFIRPPPGPGLGLELLPDLDGRDNAALRVTGAH